MKVSVVRWTAIAVLVSMGGCAVEAGREDAETGAIPSVADKRLALGEASALVASADTALAALQPNQNFGQGAALEVNRTLVKFDAAALKAAVGATDYLVGARLELTLTRNSLRRGAPARAVSAFKLNKAWTEAGATWNCAIDSAPNNRRADCSGAAAWSMGVLPPNPWTAPASASATVAPLQTGVVGFDVTSDVRGFLGAAGANQGWILMSGPFGAIADFADFGSRETATPPRLVLTVRRCSASLCDDGLACTIDSCNAIGECVHASSADGTVCDDGDACTGGDACVAGACAAGEEDLCAPPEVVVNEAESNQGIPGDWIELYNKGTTDADIGGFLVKDNDDTHVYTIPQGTVIAAGGYFVIDETPLGFGLGGADSARLFDDAGNLLDAQSWTAHAGATYGLCPNGTGTWKATTAVTKGGPNDCSVPLPQVEVNEAESNQGSPGDWIELFNKGATPADLSGFLLKDNDDTHVYTIPAGTIVAPGAFLVVDEMPLGFGLGGADSARLFTPEGTLVDAQSWTAHAATTYGLCPSGVGTWKETTAPTKGATNDCGVALPQVVVNEAESNQGVPGDWLELFNKGTAAADLSGFLVKDNDDTHIYAIPAGTMVAPGAYLVIEETSLGYGLGSADSVRLFTPDGIVVDAQSWTAHAATTYGLCPNGTGAWNTTAVSTKGAANDCSVPLPQVVVNEAESNMGSPGDWIELYNKGTTPADLSGFVVKDNDDTHAYTIPAGTIVAPGAYLVVDEVPLGFGLGGADSARLFTSDGVLVDAQSWAAHATTTYGLCPNGTGTWTTTVSPTKGAENDCGGVRFTAWPGRNAVVTADPAGTYASNLSGLTYQPATETEPAVLWAVQNSPAQLYKLVFDGTNWVSSTEGDWAGGKQLVYPDGTGVPDCEGLTRAELGDSAMYVATERNNSASGISRLSVLRFDTSAPGDVLTATHEWNVNADLPVVGANLGLEAITYIEDEYLVGNGFIDESTGLPYDPTQYADHGSGVFFVGIEADGLIYAFVLDHASTNGYQLVATIQSGQIGVMGIEFDRDLGGLWSYCDNGCGNRSTILAIETDPASPDAGKFVVRAAFNPPSTLPADMNNEGIAIATGSECVDGQKPFFWSDDGSTGGHAIRQDTIPCTPVF